jgi:hypothetical protein
MFSVRVSASHSLNTMRIALHLTGVLAACLSGPALAQASETVTLSTGFTPDKLGASTTMEFGFKIAATEGAVPSPLIDLDLHLPAGMELSSSTLGQVTCHSEALIAEGVSGCPPNSLMGRGTALVEVPTSYPLRETATVAAFMGPSENNHTVVLFYTEGVTPIAAQFVFPGQLLPDSGVYGGRLDTAIPLIPSVPGAPDVAVVRFQSTIGPSHVVYYAHHHGRAVPFRPQGIAIPTKCPPGGFPISADFSFLDGSHITARRPIPCPHRR